MTGPLSPMLLRLAEEGATGALLRDSGALYLADGVVVHAESPATPGIDVLLTAGGRLPVEVWQEAVDAAGARCRTARHLLEHRRISAAELEISHLGALYDAAFFVLAAGSGPTRFRHGVVHWFGPVRPVRVAEVERETRRRRGLLDALWPYPQLDTAPVVRRRAACLPPVPRRQRALLDLADGVRTPSAIATVLGRPTFHALVDVRRLAAAGHCETPRRAAPPPGQGRPPGRAQESASAPATADRAGDLPGPPDVGTLRRVLDALEARP
ncbi:transcriptional regulator [Streptomyces sp. CBMA29]|uniref:transcriptional regulator n=1 Tax=Streptomyces sp. CBMA29 TaxID=1896314 RepID=UPI001661FEB4|nr:transcriptional regulator [Streptomyces sp. CBMA29]MBD0735674.1 hypothetical protein [Streptomyces sp. CBMA29]